MVRRKKFETPYGPVPIARHVYQGSQGGSTYIPLERAARIIGSTTPRWAKMVSSKYANLNARQVRRDLSDNHNREVSVAYVQNISRQVGEWVHAKESVWEYGLPEKIKNDPDQVKVISIGRDGAYLLFQKEGYREAMSGTIALYNQQGQRLHTIYLGEAPEYGKQNFERRFEQEIQRMKKQFPEALYLGIADGAADNWTFLSPWVSVQFLDFYHVTEYLAAIALLAGRTEAQGKQWLKEKCHELKWVEGSAKKILAELKKWRQKKISDHKRAELEKTITYFSNHHHQMNYHQAHKNKWPIGSGVTEAACKIIIKQRFCQSGMRWKYQGARNLIALKCMSLNPERWTQFWNKINRFGIAA